MAEALEDGEQPPVVLAPAATGETPSSEMPASAPNDAVAVPVPPAAEATDSAPPAGVAMPLPSTAETAAPAAPAVAPVVPQATAGTVETPAAAPVEPPAVPSVAEGEGLVQVDFSADCWIQVSDARGRVLVSTVKRKGESLQMSGKAPLELRLGNARVAQVRYNGEPVEHLKNMTARGTALVKLGQ
ncbi:Cytoskeleton protein RodZ [compost metagenome]